MTLIVYLTGVLLSAFIWDFSTSFAARAMTMDLICTRLVSQPGAEAAAQTYAPLPAAVTLADGDSGFARPQLGARQ